VSKNGEAHAAAADPYELAEVFPPWQPLYESDELSEDPDWSPEWSGLADQAELVAKGVRSEARRRFRRYLAMNGAAVWDRVERSQVNASELRDAHAPSSLVSSMTAAELLIRYLLLRPMIVGLVFETKLAMRLIRDPFRRQTDMDRLLLPVACRAWDLDLNELQLPNGESLWLTLELLVTVRNRYVHRAEDVTAAQAQGAIDCSHGSVSGFRGHPQAGAITVRPTIRSMPLSTTWGAEIVGA
jgi:hypothetical protein